VTEIKITTTIFLLLLLILFYFKENQKDFNQDGLVVNLKINNSIYVLVLLFFTIVSQNTHLHYETIDWDTNSYLVSSLDVINGFLPYENSWESKQPLLYYVYASLILLSNFNLVIFKLLNDLILFLISFIIFKITLLKGGSSKNSFLASIFYLFLMSSTWAQVEKSELYCVLILSLILLIQNKSYKRKYSVIFTGFFLGLSVLINLGSILFVLPITLNYLIDDFNLKRYLNTIFKFTVGFLSPILFFLILYFKNNLLDIFITTNIRIPFAYTQESFDFLREFSEFFKSMYLFNPFIYFLIIFISIFSFYKITITLFRSNNKLSDQGIKTLIYLATSLGVYYIAGHGYYHHLYYLIFFLPFLIFEYLDTFDLRIFTTLILFSTLFAGYVHFPLAINNLKNAGNIYENYPLYNVSKELNQILVQNDKILATDGVLTLFYLQTSNYSYIVHPSNHKEQFITQELIEIDYLLRDELLYLISKDPKVILCSNNVHFNCEIYDWKSNYRELDIKEYVQYKPYQLYNPGSEKGEQLRVFIRND
tara:strand:- start:2223 stop:3830 length:1608 start_codon:yes stop_codon:yes gene_type:complete